MKHTFFDYLFMCHKRPDRSFFYKGKQFPICARCTGIFIGYILGVIISILGLLTSLFNMPSILVSLLFFVPLGLDGTIQLLTNYESTNIRRLLTGILTGMATMFILGNIGLIVNKIM